MKGLTILFRSLQFYAHKAHNLTAGAQFFADHLLLGDLYSGYEADYDALIERQLGLGVDVQIDQINAAAVEHSASKGTQWFAELLKSEKALCNLITAQISAQSQGTQNMLADMADRSEQRQYKLQQRLGAQTNAPASKS